MPPTAVRDTADDFGAPVGTVPRSRRRWATAAIVTNVMFVATFIVSAAWQGPHYSVLRHSISDMYADHAPHALLLIVILTVAGVMTLGFCLMSLWPALRPSGRRGAAGAAVLAASIFGVGDALTPFERLGCRLADAGCTGSDQLATSGGRLDSVLSTAGAVLLTASAFLLAWAMDHTPGLARWAGPTRWVGVALVATLIADASAASVGLQGLAERLFAILGVALIAVVALATRASSSSVHRRSEA